MKTKIVLLIINFLIFLAFVCIFVASSDAFKPPHDHQALSGKPVSGRQCKYGNEIWTVDTTGDGSGDFCDVVWLQHQTIHVMPVGEAINGKCECPGIALLPNRDGGTDI